MTEKIKENAIYDDLVAAPPDKIAELVEGSLYLSPQPAIRHVNATSVLGSDLNLAFQRGRGGPGGWWIFDEPELHLDGNVLVPDLAGWRRERMRELEPDVVGITIAPDWLCEALSPSTGRFDRALKLPHYAAAGVSYLWLVDPGARRLEVYGRHGREWVLLEEHAGAALVSAPPFEAITIELEALWA
ncbi:MAG TPA: Uma2 family endonuclease [Thermoanaerobaculia bacterium]|nr:Uma2 family endonuclease [Thermoanaerobaculia bacterium]